MTRHNFVTSWNFKSDDHEFLLSKEGQDRIKREARVIGRCLMSVSRTLDEIGDYAGDSIVRVYSIFPAERKPVFGSTSNDDQLA
jgi:hypothetical protein